MPGDVSVHGVDTSQNYLTRALSGMTPVRLGIGVCLVGLVGFFVFHWFFVAPVVAVLFEGLLWAFAGGALLGWSYERTMLDQGRAGTAWGLAFGALFASTLVPYEVVGLVWGPWETTAAPGDIARALPLAFLGVPVAVLIAWLLGRRRRVHWSFVAAVTVLHFMIGGSIANFGGRGPVALLFWGFAALEIVSGAVIGTWASKKPTRATREATAA